VRFGTFNAILVPNFLSNEIYQDQVNIPLTYAKGEWIGNFTIPTNDFGYSQFGIAGSWNIYIEGVSANGIPTFSPSTLNVSQLEVFPVATAGKIYVLPYVYLNKFSGNFAAYSDIADAIIKNHNATIVDSVVTNLTVINGTVTLVNTNVTHLNDTLGKVILVGLSSIKPVKISSGNENSPSKLQENVSSSNHDSSTTIRDSSITKTSGNSQPSGSSQLIGIGILLVILVVVALVAVITRRRFS
jgi:subtilase family serine protease